MVKEAPKKVKNKTKKSTEDKLVSYQLDKLNNIISNFEKNLNEFEILLKNNNSNNYNYGRII